MLFSSIMFVSLSTGLESTEDLGICAFCRLHRSTHHGFGHRGKRRKCFGNGIDLGWVVLLSININIALIGS